MEDNKKQKGKNQQQEKQHKGDEHKGGGMGLRGVTRPMAEKQMRQHNKQHHKQKDQHSEKRSEGPDLPKKSMWSDNQQSHSKEKKEHKKDAQHQHGGGQMMGKEMRMNMLQMHHKQTLWVYWGIIMLGVWMVMSPLTFDYGRAVAQPSGGRDVWLSLSQRISFMRWSDILSGLGLIFFGWRSLIPNRPISMWITCLIGIWLSMAPLVFWSPSDLAYLNDTLVGALVIALSILIPGMPNMITYMKMGSEVPPGWSYNPSSWPQRWIMMLAGWRPVISGLFNWGISTMPGILSLGLVPSRY